MSHFEYISVFVSIILALGVARLLDGIGPAFRSDGRSLVLIGWMIQKFLNIVLWWWILWAGLNVEWNLGLFVYEMVVPIVLYLQCKALTTPSSTSPDDWGARFEEIRAIFFVGNLVLVTSVLMVPILFPTVQMMTSSVPALILLLVIAVVGIASPHPRVQGVLITIALAIQLLGLGSAMFVVD